MTFRLLSRPRRILRDELSGLLVSNEKKRRMPRILYAFIKQNKVSGILERRGPDRLYGLGFWGHPLDSRVPMLFEVPTTVLVVSR